MGNSYFSVNSYWGVFFYEEYLLTVTPGMFRTINWSTGSKKIKNASQVKLIGVENDNELNFEQHINSICTGAANQLNALNRLKRFLGFQE